MDCDLCGTQNRASARFCGGCGSAFARRCPSCKAELDAGLSFCDQCGTTLDALATSDPRPTAATPAPAGAVRKTVTVLFADLGGSTGFGERTDPEISRQVLAHYHALLQETIDAHGGTVAKFMGDGMMATFGIPEVAEDDARRAVEAGTDMQGRFGAFADDVLARYGETLTLRVGINTGEVVIAAGDADMVGDALNVAARLEKACRPGHVLVGDETWRITRGELAYDPLGAVTVAGREQPVGTYEVAASEVAATEPVAPFVGRDEELHRLERALARAQAERAAVLVTVLGSPGVGKTRLSRELGLLAETADGARTFEIRCDRAGTATFAPIADLLRAAADLDDENESDPDGTRTRERVTLLVGADDPDAIRVVDVLAGVLGAAPARSVEETFWAIRRLFESLAGEHPLVVVIDDIQWAEPKLLDLLEHLAEWVTNAPVLLVGLARPELRELRPSLTEPGRRVADVLALDGLDRAATEALAAGLLGSALPRELVERLPASTDGNPLFVRELVRMLVDDQVIQRHEDGTWSLAIDAEAVDVPPTIQSLLGARVERLPADERRVLELASVIGAEFSVGALDHLIEGDLRVGVLLEAMRRKELVEPTGTYWGDDPVHRFHHVLIRDAAYRRLLKTSRAELHRQVGEWTDASAATLIGEHEAAIAFHYEQAHRYRTELGSLDEETDSIGQRAADLLAVASNRALDRDDLAAAGALARRALAVLPDSEAEARAELLLVACECSLASGDVGGATPIVDELRAIAGRNEQLAAWGECFRAQLVGLTDPEGLVDADVRATAAAAILARLGDGAGEAKAHQVRAGLLARLGRVGEAEAVLDLALGAARAVDDRRRVTAVLGAAPVAALFGPSPVARAGGRCLDVVRLLRITTASPSVEATSMRCQAVLEALRGRFDVSRAMLASAREALEELGITHGLLETDLFAGMVEVIAGDPAAAVAPLRSAYEGLGALGVGADAGQAGALLAQALLEQGHIDEADLAARESEAVAGQNLKTAIAWRVARARVHAARGDADAGVALAEEAVRIAAATDLVLDHADACVALADLRAAAGDAVGARAARADALRLYEAKGATVPAARLSDAASTSEDPARVPMRAPGPVAPGPDGDTRTALAVNVATRFLERLRVALNAGEYEAAGGLTADGYVFEDRRSIVAVPDVEALTSDTRGATAQGFVILEPEVVAVRGERLCLRRLVYRTPEGDESPRLVVDELDANGQLARSVFLDEDDLTVALAELDRSYYFGEGAPFQRVIRAVGRYAAAMDGGDIGEFRERMAPDFVVVDHKPLGFGAGDRAYFLEMTSVSQTDGWGINRVVYVNEHALLAVNAQTPISQHGSRYERSGCVVMGVDASDRINRIEMYADDEFAAALARLDELGATPPADPRTAVAENATTKLIARTLDLMNRGEWEALTAMNVAADGVVRFDRRRTVSAPTLNDSESFGANAAGIYEVFGVVHPEPVAVRGERLALIRLHCGEPPAFTMEMLVVYELDEDGRIAREVDFDDDDLVNALTELDARDAAGEGAAFARLDELGAEVPADPWIAKAENVTTRLLARVIDHLVGRRFDPMRELLADDFVRDDRRHGVSAPYANGPDEWIAHSAANFDVGFDAVDSRPIAVRGERLALFRIAWTSTDGRFVPFLSVFESDGEGRLLRGIHFDEDDLDVALDELDERHIAGEGAEYEYLIRRIGDFRHARGARDWDAVEALFSPDYVGVDRRPLGLGTGTRSGYIASSKAMVDLVPDATFVPRMIEVDGDVVLMRTAGSGTSVDGSRSEWEQWVVWQFAGGRVVRGEVFSFEDEPAARARFEELAHAARLTPYIDNRLVRVGERARWLARHSAETVAFYSADCVLDDRRPGVNAGTVRGSEAVAASIQSGIDVFGILDLEQLAVRGDRLTLVLWAFVAEGGFEAPGLCVNELDDDDLICRVTSFDESDLAGAIELLEQRHVELRGDSITPQELTTAVGSRAFNARDWDAMAGVFGRDLRFVTHAPFTTEGGWDDYLAQLRVLVEQVPDVAVVYAKVTTRGRCGLSLLPFTATTPEGSRYSWSMVQVTRMGDDDRIAEFELFDIEQWDHAAARFEEWAGESEVPTGAERTTSIENTASRLTAEAARGFGVEGGSGSEHQADDLVRVDHRPMIGVPTTTTREEFADAARAFADLGMTDMTFDVLAVRGDRCCLGRLTYSGADFDVRFLTVVACNDRNKTAWIDNFDEDALDAALDTLDERFIAGEGAEHHNVIRWWREFGAAYRDRDWAAVEEMYVSDAVLVDHRSIGQGWTNRADFLTSTRAVVGLVPDVAHLPRRLEIRGPVTLTDGEAFGTTSDGSRYTWGYHMVTQWAGGRITRLEMFDAEESVAACGRFDELAGETVKPDKDNDNAAARLIVDASRLLWTDLEAALERFSPDAFGVARESGPSLGLTAENRAMWRDVLGSLAATYDAVRYEPLAVRGERLALLRQKFVKDGYVTPALLLVGTDEQDRILRLETFAEEDLPTAIEELDRRSVDLLGEVPDGPIPGPGAELNALAQPVSAAFAARDWDWIRERIAPDAALEDRRSTVSSQPAVGPDAVVDLFRGFADVGFETLENIPIASRGDRLVLLRRVYRTATGFELEMLVVIETDADGLLTSVVLFDAAALVPALDELEFRYLRSGAIAHPERQVLINFAAVNHRVWRELEAILAPGVKVADHRRLGFPDATGKQHLVGALQALVEQVPDVVAIVERIESAGAAVLAQNHQVGTSAAGGEVDWVWYLVFGFDAEGLIARMEYFDTDDESAARARFDELAEAKADE